MKLVLVLIGFLYFPQGYCQKDLPQIKLVNEKVLALESNLIIQPKAFVDSSTISNEPFKELYYKNRLTDKLGKVVKIIFNPDVRVTYYFLNNLLIKAIVVDRSTNDTFTIESYFREGKLFYSTHRSIEGDNSGRILIKSANEYLKRYDIIANIKKQTIN